MLSACWIERDKTRHIAKFREVRSNR